MTQDDAFLNHLRPPQPPPSLDAAIMARASAKAAALAAGGDAPPFVSGQKSYDVEPQRKAGPAKAGAKEPPMEPIVFPCPACGTKYSVPQQHAGKSTTCKKCGASIMVPVPQVANPTIIGGTRTIRRSDIEDASSSERAAPVVKKATAPVPKPGPKKPTANFDVDMKGGDSVLRKEETVISHPPTGVGTRPHPSRVPPPPARGQGRPVPGGRPAPVPGQPGAKKKNPMPLYLGIGGGVLVVIIIVGVIIGNSGKTQGPSGGGGGKDGQSASDGAKTPGLSEDEKLLAQFDTDLKNEIGLQSEDIKNRYVQARDKAKAEGKFKDKFKSYQNQFQALLEKRVTGSSNKREVTDVALMLHNDGYQVTALLEKARTLMDRYRVVRKVENGVEREFKVPSEAYMQICEILGYRKYEQPPEFDDYQAWALKEWGDWAKRLRDIQNDVGGDDYFNPQQLEEIKGYEAKCREAGEALKARHAKDGFAINAREAFLRFKQANLKGMKKAMFSPDALGRGTEEFEEVWGYTYWNPFLVLVEKAPGRDVADLERSFAVKANMLRQLVNWFQENLVKPFNLQRTVPTEGPTVSRKSELKGRKFDTPGQLAEAEGWALEILVLKDGQTYQQFLEDFMGGGMPGARAHYYLPLRHIVTWDDPNAVAGNEEDWSNESTLMHETFHMLSDHYAANPLDWDRVNRQWRPRETRPRYFNVMIQEGLTDSVAGFVKSDDTEKAEYKFMQTNFIRLNNWKLVYEKYTGKKNLFRIQDMLRCMNYGQCAQVGFERMRELKLNLRVDQNFFVAVFYAASCQASTFLYHYKESGRHKYRDKWLDYVKADYAGEIDKKSFDPKPFIDHFKKLFAISSDKDWDKLDEEFVKFTLDLEAKNVGKDTSGARVRDDEGDDGDGSPDSPQGQRSFGRKLALPSRDEEERHALRAA